MLLNSYRKYGYWYECGWFVHSSPTVGVERCDSVYTVGSCGVITHAKHSVYGWVYSGVFSEWIMRLPWARLDKPTLKTLYENHPWPCNCACTKIWPSLTSLVVKFEVRTALLLISSKWNIQLSFITQPSLLFMFSLNNSIQYLVMNEPAK